MPVEIRRVDGEADIEAFLAIREAVDPAYPMTRESWDDAQTEPGRIDLLACFDGVAAGCAFAGKLWNDPGSTTGFVSVRVLEAHRRRGLGTALLGAVSGHVESLGCTKLFSITRAPELAAFLEHHGLVEVGRAQEVELELASIDLGPPSLPGIEIVPVTEELVPGMHAVAFEADADIPSAEPVVTGTLERWRERHLGPLALWEQSFAAVAGGEVVGYAILGRAVPGVAEHWMTGVARDWRGRGIAKALKQAQIVAAREAGIEVLRTQNDLGNAPMRRVNEQLGYRPSVEWIHLSGPVLGDVPDTM